MNLTAPVTSMNAYSRSSTRVMAMMSHGGLVSDHLPAARTAITEARSSLQWNAGAAERREYVRLGEADERHGRLVTLPDPGPAAKISSTAFLAGDTLGDIAADFDVPATEVEDVIRVATRTAA
jgi:hypothetical protein